MAEVDKPDEPRAGPLPDPGRRGLYAAVAIHLAIFMGSILARSVFLASKLRNLGDPDSARTVLVLALLIVLLQSPGCFGTRGGNLPPVEGWPPGRDDPTGAVAVQISGFREWTPASGRRYRLRDVAQYKPSILDAFSDAGLFSRVSYVARPGDFRAHVKIEAIETLRGNGWITSLTLYLIPFGRTHSYDLELKLMDSKGQLLSVCQRNETTTLWWHLAFAFTWPLNRPLTVASRVRYDLTRACLVEVAAPGMPWSQLQISGAPDDLARNPNG